MALAESFAAFLAVRAKYPGHTQFGGIEVNAALDNLISDIEASLKPIVSVKPKLEIAPATVSDADSVMAAEIDVSK